MKVGMVGRGVMVAVGVLVEIDVLVIVGAGEAVIIASRKGKLVAVGVAGKLCPHAVRTKIPPSRLIKICFNVLLLILVLCSCFAFSYDLNGNPQIKVPIFPLSSLLSAPRSLITSYQLSITTPASPLSRSVSASPKIHTRHGSDSRDNANN